PDRPQRREPPARRPDRPGDRPRRVPVGAVEVDVERYQRLPSADGGGPRGTERMRSEVGETLPVSDGVAEPLELTFAHVGQGRASGDERRPIVEVHREIE